jgi:uncharacterized protein YndB with AHSA1/START domain
LNLPHTVTRSVLLPVSPAAVWETLTDESALSEWLATEVEIEPHQGGELLCRYEDGEERRGEVELIEEAERLAFEWRREGQAPSRVEFVIDAVAEGSRLTVIETSIAPTVLAAAWTARLTSLGLVLGRLVLA